MIRYSVLLLNLLDRPKRKIILRLVFGYHGSGWLAGSASTTKIDASVAAPFVGG